MMGTIRSHKRVVQRWDWTAFGYEVNFPRGCQFSDIDAVVEFDGAILIIESKHHDGQEPLPRSGGLSTGQRLLYKELLRRIPELSVLVLHGDAMANSPWGLYDVRSNEWLADLRDHPLDERREHLHNVIDARMGRLGKKRTWAA